MATILVVDDDLNNRLLVATLLEPAGHVVLEAANGADALACARERSLDLILADLSMPGLSGAALVRALRSDPVLADTAIALYTASAPTESIRDFMRAFRIRTCIPKPSEPLAFIRAVESALSS